VNDVRLTIRGLRVRALEVPRPQGKSAGRAGVTTSAFVLVDLETEQGVTGSTYIYCTLPIAQKPVAQLLASLNEPLRGESAIPVLLREKLKALFRLSGAQGIVGLVWSAIDIAAWDALAKAVKLPLVRLLGGEPRAIPAYVSFGVGLIGPEQAGNGAGALVEPGFGAIKVRFGYPDVETEVEVVRAVRDTVGPHIQVSCDYNQSLTLQEAIRRGRRLDEEDLLWIEEPIFAGNYGGLAAVAREVRTPIQAGENYWSPLEMKKAMDAGATDFVMPDASRIGGVTGWIQAAALAEVNETPLSSHLIPEVSAQLLSLSPNCHWLEYVDWANPILKAPLKVESGRVIVSETPGAGLEWDENAVAHFLVGEAHVGR
jgi:mandelate racemase